MKEHVFGESTLIDYILMRHDGVHTVVTGKWLSFACTYAKTIFCALGEIIKISVEIRCLYVVGQPKKGANNSIAHSSEI